METNDQNSKKDLLFKEFNSEDVASEPIEIESLCLKCGKNGSTRLLLTKIPFYKEIIIMSFSCLHCGFSNNETQFGGKIQDTGIRIKVKIQNNKDLNREVVRSDYATISIPELDFEIPPARKGEVTTIEGILDTVITNLEVDHPNREKIDPKGAEKIQQFVERIRRCKDLKTSFHFILIDPSGNSFVENLFSPQKDEAMEVAYYKLSREDEESLGIYTEGEHESMVDIVQNENEPSTDVTEEVMTFPTNCSNCNSPCTTNMKMTKIPHFKEVVIMATNCDVCGHRTNEVKSGSGIEPLGVKIKLNIKNPMDLTRDILKSENCNVSIPELDFEMGAGTIGGKFTTLEGLLQNIKEQLLNNNPFLVGDSAQSNLTEKMLQFGNKLDEH